MLCPESGPGARLQALSAARLALRRLPGSLLQGGRAGHVPPAQRSGAQHLHFLSKKEADTLQSARSILCSYLHCLNSPLSSGTGHGMLDLDLRQCIARVWQWRAASSQVEPGWGCEMCLGRHPCDVTRRGFTFWNAPLEAWWLSSSSAASSASASMLACRCCAACPLHTNSLLMRQY